MEAPRTRPSYDKEDVLFAGRSFILAVAAAVGLFALQLTAGGGWGGEGGFGLQKWHRVEFQTLRNGSLEVTVAD